METITQKIRTRFAPSPTGFVHVGSLRTALYNYLFARRNGGDFLLRIEDTDRKRYVEGSVEILLDALRWSGLEWDEGIMRKTEASGNFEESSAYPGLVEFGKHGPYVQSERLHIYREYAENLIQIGYAYYCFCDAQRLEQMRYEQKLSKRPPMYDRCCVALHESIVREKLDSGSARVIRFKVDREKTVVFDDMIRGRVSFSAQNIDDQVLMKSDGFPTYHLASVVDDHLMQVSHVIRGEEWLPSTPKHILLYEAFGWDIPRYAHLPLLLNADKSKLSKRQGDVAVSDYISKGYLRDAIVNFSALLGWNPGQGSTQEIFSLEELKRVFDVQKVHKAGAVFDIKKLDWINAQYIKKMHPDELYREAVPFLEQKPFFQSWKQKTLLNESGQKDFIQKVLAVEQGRLSTLASAGDANPFFFFPPEVSLHMLQWKDMSDDQVRNNIQIMEKSLSSLSADQWTLPVLEQSMLKTAGDKRGEFLWPVRVALTGAQKSPSPFEVAWVLGRDETMRRICNAIRAK